MPTSCPGARVIKEPQPLYAICPHCKTELEMWTDEFRTRCTKCDAWVYRQLGATCLDWCAKAQECVGAPALEAYQSAREARQQNG